jgi:hypothetical protein
MIVQNVKVGEINSLKLITGEEIVARIVEDTAFVYTISKPLVLSVTAQGVALTPFLFTAEINGEINIPKTAVVAVAQTDKQTASQYIKGTSDVQTAYTTNIGKMSKIK